MDKFTKFFELSADYNQNFIDSNKERLVNLVDKLNQVDTVKSMGKKKEHKHVTYQVNINETS